MFKRAGRSLGTHLLRLRRQASTAASTAYKIRHALPGLAVVAGGATVYALSSNPHVHNDAVSLGNEKKDQVKLIPGGSVGESDELRTVVWGSNKSNILLPLDVEEITTPSIAEWLDGVALRDLVLHEGHAACVDARGDVYQWGQKFSGQDGERRHEPTLTLRGKNITQLKLTVGRVYALSVSGKVYALDAEANKQDLLPGRPTPSSDGWWGTGWLWGEDETVDFVEITPREGLVRGERFVSIDAGDDHLLALTSRGRVFAHPVTKKANTHGQLGFSKFQIPDPSALLRPNSKNQLMQVELIPKTVADPYVNSSRGFRPSPPLTVSPNLLNVDDKHVRFCTHLFEIPVLKGIEIAQVATGSRSSFVRTAGGRVLSWGANDHGQLGLGSNMVLDTITVPTEVVLWRAPATQATTVCLDVSAGGDLTAFTVEKVDQSPKMIDVRMCGNGQWGGLGTTTLSTAQATPQPAKNISGLAEYNDTTKGLQPISPRTISISPTGHVLATLNNTTATDVGGRDLVLWGRNYQYELGNNKKSNILLPMTLETAEGGRFMLRTKKAKVNDLHGKLWKRWVPVEQQAVAGYQSSGVYWKIVGR